MLASSLLLSSLLGLYRDRILNRLYLDCTGSCYPVGIDAYTAAFTIPDFMFFILVSGALSVTFIPVFNKRLITGNKKSAWQLSSSMINILALVTLIASVLIMIFAEPLVNYVVAPGLSESGQALAVSMMRVIAINPFLFAITTVITSMQQAVGRFVFYALAPTIYNVGIIIGALSFTQGIEIFGWRIFDGGIMGVALGVVLGAVMQLIVSAIGLFGLGFDYRFKIFWKNKGFRRALSLLPARSVDQSMDYIVSIVEMNLASRMAAGTMRIYQQASALHMMPINLIGVAISTAAFPSMTEQLVRGEDKEFRHQLQSVVRVIIWLALPIAAITYFARGYIASFVAPGGSPLMAGILGALVVAILFRSIFYIAARSFYAREDTKTPLYVSLFAISINVALAMWFTLGLDLGAYGLAYAQSLVAIVEVVMLFYIINRRMEGGLFDRVWFHAVARMTSATGFMAIITYVMVRSFQLQSGDLSLSQTLPKFFIITIVSAAAYLVFCHWLKIDEARPVTKQLNRILFNTKK